MGRSVFVSLRLGVRKSAGFLRLVGLGLHEGLCMLSLAGGFCILDVGTKSPCF